MHLGGLLSTQEARVALGYRLVSLRSMAVLGGRAKYSRRARAEKPRGDWGGSNLKNRLHGWGAFLSRSVSQRTDRCDWFGTFACQSNILVISHERVSRD